MISFPFDNKSATEQDRNIDSDTFAEYLKSLTGGQNGVFAEVGTKLQVTAGTGMTVLVNPGDGFIEGRLFIENSTRELQVQASESLDRIDTVVVRLNKEQRLIDLYIVKGIAATVPTAPALTRAGGIYELGIANVYVPKLTSNITQERITDTRLNTERCGIAPVLGEIDTQGLYEQYQASLDAFLELVDTAIDGTTAGNLQSQIDVLTNNVDILTGNVDILTDNVDISNETIAAFEALGWTPPAGGAVIESLLDWISNHAEFYKQKGSSGNWSWKEDADGKIEAYINISNSININAGTAPVFYNSTETIITIPNFIKADYVSIEWQTGGSGIIFPYARIVGQNVYITYMRFYGGTDTLTMQYRLKVKGTRKA